MSYLEIGIGVCHNLRRGADTPGAPVPMIDIRERERERDFFIRRLKVQIPMNTYNKSQIKDSSPDFPHRGIVGQITGKQSRYNSIA